MRLSRYLLVLFLSAFCLCIGGLAEAGKGGHPEQFPYPDNFAEYNQSKTGCAIQAFENGAFDVFFQGGLDPASITPAPCSGNVYAYLYDPTTMSNTAKKIVSSQASYINFEIGCPSFQVPSSSMNATADAKKASATVKISDASLADQLYGDASIRPQGVIDYAYILTNAGFKLKSGWWTATCSAKRSLTQ